MSQVNWSSYANVYDMILLYNPAYQEIISHFCHEIQSWPIHDGETVADVGAGTGNFSIELAKQFQNANILHIDADEGMNKVAESKSSRLKIENLSVVTTRFEELELSENSLAGIVCVHALYTLSDPKGTLNQMSTLLRTGGMAFFCDIGRVLVINDWFKYFTFHLLATYGVWETAQILWKGREVTKQNRMIRKAQIAGAYWTHTHDEFCETVTNSGFDVIKESVYFRGYSDLVIARKR